HSINSPDSTSGAVGHGAGGSLGVNVSYDELAATREPAEDWLTYPGSYWSSRHSALRQLNRENVHQLALRWIHEFDGQPTTIEVTPIVRRGIMFVTEPPGRVTALDATTGRDIWTYGHNVSRESLGGEFGAAANRGVAILNDKVFFGRVDARLIAASAATGALLSDVAVALRGSTGALVWHFQFTPADDHDWDANQIPVLADQKTAQGTEKRVLWANRNGFYYVLDRVSGKYLTAAPFAHETWTDSLDPQ